MISGDLFRAFLANYNSAVFPAHILLYALGIGAAAFVLSRPGKWGDVAAKGVLAFLWIWLGVFYMFIFYGRVNSAGYTWGTLFILQGLFFAADIVYPKTHFRPYAHPNLGHLGAAVAGWAFVGYPITALIVGRRWPELALFGCATPIVIYTCGMLLFTFDRKPRWRFTFIPFLWTVVGGLGAAVEWRYYEDYALFLAGVVLVASWAWAARKYKAKK